jgi:hypothetical protein
MRLLDEKIIAYQNMYAAILEYKSYFELFIMSLFLRLECELNVETDVTCSRHAEHINALQSITY